MQNLGLSLPPPQQINIGGIMSAKPLRTLLAQEATAAAIARASENQDTPVVQELSGLIRRHWTAAKAAKVPIEKAMIEALHSRRGEYTPEKLDKIRKQGGSEIFMMMFATKARQAKALLTDVLIGSGEEKPWTLHPTPSPELPPQETEAIMRAAHEVATQAELSGNPLSVDNIRQLLVAARDQATNAIQESAQRGAGEAERKLADVMSEGGWMEALDDVIDDMAVFKSVFLKGPTVRNVPTLEWQVQPDGSPKATSVIKPRLEWDRVDPLMMYPAAWAKTVDDAYLIERHRLSRGALSAMIGVDGYSDDAIRAVLDAHGTGGLREWLSVDTARAPVEGNTQVQLDTDLIDALQYWGSVSGKMLREWGLNDGSITDEAKEYEVEAWLIGSWVIKASLNPDPLLRRPYYMTGYSRVPGAFWNNCLYDLLADCEGMCNAAARALANNLGISSGPQVVINNDRLASGEVITEMFPWKLWQTVSDPMGSSAAPISFFQPQSNAAELMGVYERYASMADDYSGIPKYMTGTPGDGGAGRTASGMSMMIGNASKQIKELVSAIDIRIITRSVERAHLFMIQNVPGYDYHGDITVKARGALSLAVKESAQVRRNEFLAATMNPVDMQIIGMDGRAELLRASAKTLDLNVDRVVPNAMMVRQRAAQAQQQQQAQAQLPQPGAAPPGGGQELMNGAPVVDNFQQAPT